MDGQLGQFKGQPWIVFDTIAARSFLVGESRPEFAAFGTKAPAITRDGSLIFFNSGRTRAQVPWYTNMDLDGQLSYGMRVWGVYLHFGFPVTPEVFSDDPESSQGELTYGAMLANAIIDFGVLSLLLGQEDQMDFPVSRFGAGGGLSVMGGLSNVYIQNSLPQSANIMTFPEPIDMSRTINIDAKIRLAPEVIASIGTNDAPGVGCELLENGYELEIVSVDGDNEFVEVPFLPYTIQCGLIGERIKKTQYGQLPGDQG